jgi:DegV family protein with EDD domain
MGSACIVTDSSAQFTFPGFPGKKCLKILEHEYQYMNSGVTVSGVKKANELPAYTNEQFRPKIIATSAETISATLSETMPFYDDIFVILLSKEISSLYQETEKISHTLHGHADLHIIDSQNTSLGLGLLVQQAAEAIIKEMPVEEIEKKLRLVIPHIYTVLCTPNLSYLYSAGVLDIGQATVGEMLSLYSLFVMEDGKLNPLQKVKNQRSAIDYFIEFVDEFDDLSNLAFIQPTVPAINESKLLHQHLDEMFPHTIYTEHLINPFLSTMFGPRGFGMVVMENTEKLS